MNVQRRSLRRTLLLLLGLVAISLPVSASLDELKKAFQTSPYAVIHSKYAAVSRGAFYRLSWIDNDRVFFAGEPIEEVLARFDGKRFVGAGKIRFYIWNTRTNEVVPYRQNVNPFGTYCYNEFENWIRYPVPGKKDAVMEGRLGEERETRRDPSEHTTEARARRHVFYQAQTCREHPYSPEGRGVGSRRVFPLFDAHGILDVWGSPNDATPIRLFSDSYEKLQEFALPRRAVVPQNIYFSRYKRAYVLTGYTAPPSFSNTWGSWPEGVNQPVYLLSERGELSLAGEIPWYEGYRAAVGVYLTQKGIVYADGTAKRNGFYLVSGKSAITLLRAPGPKSLDAGGVSPDGCKVSAAISMYGANTSGGLKVIDLCGGNDK